MSDLVERLRKLANECDAFYVNDQLIHEAADRIEELEKIEQAARELIEDMKRVFQSESMGYMGVHPFLYRRLRDALDTTEDDK